MQEKERAEEAEKVEEAAAGVAAQRKAGVVRAERRRQLKNALLWQRDSMRTPLDLNTTRWVDPPAPINMGCVTPVTAGAGLRGDS